MKTRTSVLYLGPFSPLVDWLRTSTGQADVILHGDDLPVVYPVGDYIDVIVSYNYRHIVPYAVLASVPLAVNLHISYLPWNRGADPNLWSHIDNTPKGVSLHHMTTRLDGGDVIAQRHSVFDSRATLRTSYEQLQTEAQQLFMDTWPSIVDGTARRTPQVGVGSYHRSSDRERVMHRLIHGWDTLLQDLR